MFETLGTTHPKNIMSHPRKLEYASKGIFVIMITTNTSEHIYLQCEAKDLKCYTILPPVDFHNTAVNILLAGKH
jgi:hypothetical protein